MFPYFTLFGRPIGLYQLMALLGALAAGLFACRAAKKRGFEQDDMIVLLLVASIGVLLGGHLLYALTNFPLLLRFVTKLDEITSWSVFWERIGAIFGGAVFYGGLLGGLAAGAIWGRKKGLDLAAYADMATPAIPLFHMFGRIGCFLGGCCYGIEHRFGLVYTRSLIVQANGVSRFPVQLAEALFNLGLFALLSWLLKKGALRHRLLSLYLMLYAIGRFLLEFLRGDEIRGFIAGLSTSQWIGIAVFIAALICFFRRAPKEA